MSISAQLTPREHEVHTLLLKGWPTKQIAAHLAISVKTVDFYVTRVLQKCGVRRRVELILSHFQHVSGTA